MLSEDAKIPAALLAERAKIARIVGWIVRAFKSGGRLFYVGAGTSGRLGILDASECPPTFRVALTHDGSLGQAHAFVDAIADAGADAVKFQTHIAAAESTPAEPFRVHFSRQDATRYDYWKRMEFTEEQWRGLAEHARERGILFLSSAFSIEAVDLLERIGMPLWKVGSGETSNTLLLDRMAATGAPVLLSSGMSPIGEIDAAVARIAARNVPVGLRSEEHTSELQSH